MSWGSIVKVVNTVAGLFGKKVSVDLSQYEEIGNFALSAIGQLLAK